MKRNSVLLLALLAFAPGCEDDPAPAPTTALPPVFTATLTSAAEVPAPTSEQSCSGTIRVQLNVTRASATSPITAANADFNATVTGCPTTTVITAAHIHEAAVGVPGGVVINTGIASNEWALANGAGTFAKNQPTVDVAVAQRLIDNPAGFYFNIHSTANGQGFIRGQLTKIQ
jgi:hypothetical protein